jgi:hypothetical protein
MTLLAQRSHPLMPLDVYRREFGINPFHFWQLANSKISITASCNALLYQYAWMNADTIGRAELMEAVVNAEQRLIDWLGYSPAPHYVSEIVPWPHYEKVGVMRYPYVSTRYSWMPVRAHEGMIQACGVESLIQVTDAAAVVYSDPNGDGINEKFTVTVATSITDPALIAIYFSTADRTADSFADSRIEPVTVSISGGNAVITGNAWLLVRPVLYEGYTVAPLDPANAATFVATVAVWQRSTYTNGQTLADAQCVLQYETHPCPWFCVGGCIDCSPTAGSTDVATVGYAVGRMGIRDSRRGLLTPASEVYDPVAGTWSSSCLFNCTWEPDRVQLNYLAGMPLDNGQIPRKWATIVARFAAAEMSRPICACADANREVYRWQFDLARSAGQNDEAYGLISRADLENPFGTRRGHVYAWREVNQLALRIGTSN